MRKPRATFEKPKVLRKRTAQRNSTLATAITNYHAATSKRSRAHWMRLIIDEVYNIACNNISAENEDARTEATLKIADKLQRGMIHVRDGLPIISYVIQLVKFYSINVLQAQQRRAVQFETYARSRRPWIERQQQPAEDELQDLEDDDEL